jgi:hypothetical protein
MVDELRVEGIGEEVVGVGVEADVTRHFSGSAKSESEHENVLMS